MEMNKIIRKCCVPFCTSSTTNIENNYIGFYPFPADKELKTKWLEIIFGTKWEAIIPSVTDYVCSRHFLRKSPDFPTIFWDNDGHCEIRSHEQEENIRISQYGDLFLKNLKDLQLKSMLTDITINKTFPAHKIVLAIASPFFKNLFEVFPKISSLDLSVSDEICNIMLTYVYFGTVILYPSVIEDVEQFCISFDLTGLSKICFEWRKENLINENLESDLDSESILNQHTCDYFHPNRNINEAAVSTRSSLILISSDFYNNKNIPDKNESVSNKQINDSSRFALNNNMEHGSLPESLLSGFDYDNTSPSNIKSLSQLTSKNNTNDYSSPESLISLMSPAYFEEVDNIISNKSKSFQKQQFNVSSQFASLNSKNRPDLLMPPTLFSDFDNTLHTSINTGNSATKNKDGPLTDSQTNPQTSESTSCSLFPVNFSNNIELQNHVSIKHKSKKHICNVCGLDYSTLNDLSIHIEHHKPESVVCPYCDFKSVREITLKRHVSVVHKEYSHLLKCSFCSFEFENEFLLIRHLENTHHSQPINEFIDLEKKCLGNEKAFASPAKLSISALNKIMISCPYCPNTYKTVVATKKHIKIHRKTFLLKCTECDFTCKRLDALAQHMANVHEYPSKSHLLQNYDPQSDCSNSGYSKFPSKENRIEKSNSSDSLDNTVKSPKLFKARNDEKNKQNRLIYKNSEVKNHFVRRYNTRPRKSLRHLDQKIIPMTKLNTFPQSTLDKSDLSIKNSKMFSCPYCAPWTSNLIDLENHILATHKNNIVYTCPLCESETHSYVEFIAHVKKVHNLDNKNESHLMKTIDTNLISQKTTD